MATTRIEWTESTWNPVTGCTRISPGCKNCYAARMAKRLHAMGQENYRNGFEVTLHPHMLDYPLRWKKPMAIFVNSMSDLFHESVPFDYIEQVFRVMRLAKHHAFQVLTKRAERLEKLAPAIDWPGNVWMGVTVESGAYAGRIDRLRSTEAKVKFISFEPLIGPVDDPDLSGVDWAIVGGESGPGARPMDPDWARALRDACRRDRVPFFFKQWGGFFKKRNGRLLDGRTWDGMPERKMEALRGRTTA